MYSYKIIIAYDGTDYHGWQQQQHDHVTIMHALQKTFYDVFGKRISINGASRTDAGVHALGQVGVFSVDMAIDPKRMKSAWNAILPPAIVIRSIERSDASFNPQRNVDYKIYHYYIFTRQPLPYASRYGYYVRDQLDIEKLKQGLSVFVGTHDFRSFCTLYDKSKNTVRTINSIDVIYIPRYKAYRVVVKGPSFLHFMIRRIVGACIEVATRPDLTIDILRDALVQRDPRQWLPKAPAQGLVLYKIKYKVVA